MTEPAAPDDKEERMNKGNSRFEFFGKMVSAADKPGVPHLQIPGFDSMPGVFHYTV
ncbi:hypothetical protein OOO55_004729 [Salmonella enterica]|nr:hypothetical protein [Salmonella enterica]